MGILPSIDLSATGIRIAQLRQQTGLTVQDLQNIFGLSTPQAIYKWQRGVSMPTIDNLVVLSVTFRVPIERILVVDTGI